MGKFLFHIARVKMAGAFVGFIFTYLPFLIPIRKTMQNDKVVAMPHPAAAYLDHILLIPRKLAANIFCLSARDFIRVIEMATEIRREDDRDFVLLINGGDRQEVMQAHFHLYTGNESAHQKASLPFEIFYEVRFDLHDILKKNGISEKSFSLIIQFEANNNPVVYLT